MQSWGFRKNVKQTDLKLAIANCKARERRKLKYDIYLGRRKIEKEKIDKVFITTSEKYFGKGKYLSLIFVGSHLTMLSSEQWS